MAGNIYRAQPIGSLLRPAWVRDARSAQRKGEMPGAEFKRIEDRAVDEALALQERAGLDVVNDGEQRRVSFLGSLAETTEGLSRTSGLTKPWHDDDQHVEQLSLALAVTGKPPLRRSLVGQEFTFARSQAHEPLKVTLPQPLTLL